MPSTEAGLQRQIVKAIKRAHPAAWVFHPVGNPYQEAGVPDLLACVEGRLFAFEIKHQKAGESHEHALSRVTPVQRVQLGRIGAAGGHAAAVTTVDAALRLIETTLGES